MMSYHVGQVLFVILNKKTQVYPMMVVEEIIKKTDFIDSSAFLVGNY